jgi:GalNAc-alpha-(1->4)-GalNAc-alpha-(1->3)-diNAcBac-PP-undecaprenol alpha-1,4-N-acetyl-D-galactosaminyltransferase
MLSSPLQINLEVFTKMIQSKSSNHHVLCLVIPSLQAGGMERVMSELARYFSSRAELEVHLVLYGSQREIFFKVPAEVSLHVPRFTFSNRVRIISTIRTILYLRKTIRQIDPETVLSFGEYWNNFVLISLRGLKYPVYVSDRSQPDKSLGKLHDRLRRWLYPGARGLILQTEQAKEIYLRDKDYPHIRVIGNPIIAFRTPGPNHQREKSILMVGRLIESKHQDKLIEMFAKVAPADWILRIVGFDHQKQYHMERLKELARELGVGDQVIFMGKQDEMEEIYLKASIFAFTSSSEGFPNVIGEAMSAGMPVVSFDCVAGPSEMIQDAYNGFLVPLFDTPAFESKLDLLIRDENLRLELGANARESIQRFSSDKVYESFYRIIFE